MTSLLSNSLEKASRALDKTEHGAKVAQLSACTKDNTHPDWRITTDYGVKQSNTDEWLKVASEDHVGPALLEDAHGREKIMRFDHERIPERVVHARGAGAFGTFKLLESAADVTSAGVLTDTSRSTPVFVRFSTVLGSRGSPDTVRDVRGFAVKFYTEEGNWDLVGNNIPVFFIQDAIKFPDVIHAAKPEPQNEIPQAQSAHNNFWDFMYMAPEATHMFLWAMSDRAIPRSYRMMEGFGVNTFTLINEKGERSFVKFHWKPTLGVHSLVWDEAIKINGADPDFHRKDLFMSIENGAYPKWRFGIQVLPESREHDFPDFDILDATKIWPEDEIPIRWIGELELNRNPDEYFPEVEQIAFCTSHVVPGIGFSDDPLLQGRNFSYFDTQISRLGVNFQELPINRPVCPVMNHNRDGKLRHTITKGPANYWPNRFGAVPPAKPSEGAYIDYPAKIAGIKARLRSKKFGYHWNQAQLFYNSLTEIEKEHVAAALSFELDHCEDNVVYDRMCERLADIDLALAQKVATMVGGPIPQQAGRPNHGKKTRGISQLEKPAETPTIATRRVAIIIADGYDPVAYNGMKAALLAAQALPFTIAPRRSPIFAAGEDRNTGKGVKPDHHLEGMRSVLFDAIFLPGGTLESIQTLRSSGRAMHWVREAFGHLKPIGATGGAVALVKEAFAVTGLAFSEDASEEAVESYGVVTAGKVSPDGFKEVVSVAKAGADFCSRFFYAISCHRNFERELKGYASMVAF
ncbi:catalase-domain-containing protein [Trichodelitschia bisporula]|uniref:Catalase n=1 Tax=Trichodelitschia bisporula TaxID=703511 RepID=A0A6G1I1F9_9PEZI|nr:catalase-domain-containing protein [Trichodelitschia bisporula]